MPTPDTTSRPFGSPSETSPDAADVRSAAGSEPTEQLPIQHTQAWAAPHQAPEQPQPTGQAHLGATAQQQPHWFDTSNLARPLVGDTHPAPAASDAATPPSGGPVFPAPPTGAHPHTPGERPRGGMLRTATVALIAGVAGAGLTLGGAQAGLLPGVAKPAASASVNSGTTTTAGSTGTATTTTVVQADPENPNWTAVAAAVTPSVVSIRAESGNGSGGEGSGVVIDTQGHVLTNDHVVSGADQLSVTFADGRTYRARVQGTDPQTDLAVITVQNPPSDLKPIAIGDSSKVVVGEPVMAVGNPLGLSSTVTTGIVSALNRPVTTREASSSGAGSEPVFTNAIQTSAAINPGNSGGALVDGSGRLIGINSAIASLGSSASGGQSGSIGIGFAIPVAKAESISQQLISTGKATHAYLGVGPQDGTGQDGAATRSGAAVAQVYPSTPAAAAGLKRGDLIVAIGGEPVGSAESLIGQIRERQPGATVTLTVLRAGQSVEVPVTLGSR